MATYTYNGFFRYDGTTGTVTFDRIVGGGETTGSDGESDTTWEIGDTINGAAFAGSFQMPLSGGGSVEVPVLTFSGESFFLIPQGMSSTDFNHPATIEMSTLDTTPFTVCFARDTRIATPSGEAMVQDLKIGDLILTADGTSVAVKWLGVQTVSTRFRLAERLTPVRITAGALGGGLPHSDLTVTADHGMVLDGLVVNASALVNGDTIDFVPMDELEDSFTVYHIETENHDVILANGAASETFVDAVTRGHFDNYQEYLDIYGAERIIPEMDRPRISTQRLLPDAIKARLGIAEHSDSIDMLRQA